MNAAELLGGNESLISIRKSSSLVRPFHKLKTIQQNANNAWRAQDDRLTTQLIEIQSSLDELDNKYELDGLSELTYEKQQAIVKLQEDERKDPRRKRSDKRTSEKSRYLV